jgi:hypothetical protein
VANPSGFWANLIAHDLPSEQQLEERTDEICQKLNDGEIPYSEAYYLWQQAFLEYKNRAPAEIVREAGKIMKEPFENLIDIMALQENSWAGRALTPSPSGRGLG